MAILVAGYWSLVSGNFRKERIPVMLAKLTSDKKPATRNKQPFKNSLLNSAFVLLPPALLKPLTKKQQ
jgi:hypothetical protein